MKFDVKSVVIGLLLGVIVMLVTGAGGDRGSGIGFAVPSGAKAILKASNGEAFIINMDTAMAERILFKKPEPDEPRYPTTAHGFPLILAD
jgi:hypothetical protein